MRTLVLSIFVPAVLLAGCSSGGNADKTMQANRAVLQADATQVKKVSISDLRAAYLDESSDESWTGAVVEISGTVVAFAMSKKGLYSVTLSDGSNDAVCIFDASLASAIGEGRPVRAEATLAVQGQCGEAGMFASSPFQLDGCRLVD
jgi:hypothetical protein